VHTPDYRLSTAASWLVMDGVLQQRALTDAVAVSIPGPG
jgi:hypothetical protein